MQQQLDILMDMGSESCLIIGLQTDRWTDGVTDRRAMDKTSNRDIVAASKNVYYRQTIKYRARENLQYRIRLSPKTY